MSDRHIVMVNRTKYKTAQLKSFVERCLEINGNLATTAVVEVRPYVPSRKPDMSDKWTSRISKCYTMKWISTNYTGRITLGLAHPSKAFCTSPLEELAYYGNTDDYVTIPPRVLSEWASILACNGGDYFYPGYSLDALLKDHNRTVVEHCPDKFGWVNDFTLECMIKRRKKDINLPVMEALAEEAEETMEARQSLTSVVNRIEALKRSLGYAEEELKRNTIKEAAAVSKFERMKAYLRQEGLDV